MRSPPHAVVYRVLDYGPISEGKPNPAGVLSALAYYLAARRELIRPELCSEVDPRPALQSQDVKPWVPERPRQQVNRSRTPQVSTGSGKVIDEHQASASCIQPVHGTLLRAKDAYP
jgi:hypothetical protein